MWCALENQNTIDAVHFPSLLSQLIQDLTSLQTLKIIFYKTFQPYCLGHIDFLNENTRFFPIYPPYIFVENFKKKSAVILFTNYPSHLCVIEPGNK